MKKKSTHETSVKKTGEKKIFNNNSSSSLKNEINDFSKEIEEIVADNGDDSLFRHFVKKFLNYVPVDYRDKNEVPIFGEFASQAYDFFYKRDLNKKKVEIVKEKYLDNPSITIKILSDNKPFIIDSVNCLIIRLKLETMFTFHPVIHTKRDKDGKLINIGERDSGLNAESMVFIKIVGDFEDETIAKLKNEINEIISLVSITSSAWDDILNRIVAAKIDITHNQKIYQGLGADVEDNLEFIDWLQKHNFTYLGVADFDCGNRQAALIDEVGVKAIWQDKQPEINHVIQISKTEGFAQQMIMLGKLNKISPVHKNSLIDYVLIKKFDKQGAYIGGTIIFGLYGSAIYHQSIESIPILRHKMQYVLDSSGFPVNGYNAKKIKMIIESLPRDILIQMEAREIYNMALHMLSSMRSKKLKLFVEQDWSGSFLSNIIFLPREHLSPESYNIICNYLSDKFNSEITQDALTVVSQDFAHIFAVLPVDEGTNLEVSVDEMYEDISNITTNWHDSLQTKFIAEHGEFLGRLQFKVIENIFPEDYRHKHSASTSYSDIKYVRQAHKEDHICYNLQQKSEGLYCLKIYSNKSLILSDILPSIENIGFKAVEEQSFHIKACEDFGESWINEFTLQAPGEVNTSFAVLKVNVESALQKMNQGLLDSDSLSKLLVLEGFDWTQVKLMKAITRYLHQTGFIYGKGYVQLTLIKHHKFARYLADFFDARFNPKNASPERQEEVQALINSHLESITSSAEDKVLRYLYLIFKAILRTNFYQTDDSHIKDYISFKFTSKDVPDLPKPVPYAEIFVYSHEFEGVHLRGGMVARGGLRWSDRSEDYRTEVHGLIKAQMTKNTVIVPVGSKGTFCLHFGQGGMTREEYMARAVECYQNYLRGLLDLTDNLVSGKIIKPKKTVCLDGDDYYLVVAADKGTASFSDYANNIANEYNFWLGDAFASGGSVGYDHKKMGITAKGAWISARHHFMSMGIDIQKEPVKVIGVGDMSGDVFGNGMLLSRAIKLVAAFNHEHIFIDPNPDPETSYQERERLFKLPRSKWTDYNEKLISKGGGVFSKNAKHITISKEVQELLDLPTSILAPEELIKAILLSRVDLLWNGGIGTYVKATSESNVEIGDKANDSVRVNGAELKLKVIGEGGNLGMSQLGRVEFALNGGKMNTDFIDNSAGVDCSDHEVNIKIALNQAVEEGKITVEQRNKLLVKMTDEVEKLVLIDNTIQNQVLTNGELSPYVNIESFSQLITEFENEGLLSREVEFLPSKNEIARRTIAGQNMSRPELAVLLSYSKMSVDRALEQSGVIDDEYFTNLLINYFPTSMHKEYKKCILNHPLRQDIVRTILTNRLVNHIGGPAINAICRETSGEMCDIIRAHAVVCDIFKLEELWRQVEECSNIDMATRVEMYADLGKIMRRGISWLVKNEKSPLMIEETVSKYQRSVSAMQNFLASFLSTEGESKIKNKIHSYAERGVATDLATDIAKLEILVSAFDIAFISEHTKTKDDMLINLYFVTSDLLHIDWLRKSCEGLISESFWNRLSIQSLKDDFYDKQRRFIITALKNDKKSANNMNEWLQNQDKAASIFMSFVEEIKLQENIDLNMIILANKKFELFLRKLSQNLN